MLTIVHVVVGSGAVLPDYPFVSALRLSAIQFALL